jgi:hypothetical protein
VNRDLLAATVSGFIAALALAVSTYNVYLQHKQVRAQVWPRVIFGPSLNDEEGFSYKLENGGIGPAQIETLRVLVDGKPADDWPDVVRRLTGKEVEKGAWAYWTIHGSVLTPAQSRRVFWVKDPELGSALFHAQQRVRPEICYCSALDDCWVLEQNRPRAVGKCPSWEQPFQD